MLSKPSNSQLEADARNNGARRSAASQARTKCMAMNEFRPLIERTIRQLGEDYRSAPASMLTEDDLKCLLVSRLSQLPELSGVKPTHDVGIRGTMVHSEVPWYDEDGRLTIKP